MSREVVGIPLNGSFYVVYTSVLRSTFYGGASVALRALLIIKELCRKMVGASVWHFGALRGKSYDVVAFGAFFKRLGYYI